MVAPLFDACTRAHAQEQNYKLLEWGGAGCVVQLRALTGNCGTLTLTVHVTVLRYGVRRAVRVWTAPFMYCTPWYRPCKH
jgi:hypothetical protein